MTTYNLDLAHSTIDFRVKHLMVSQVKGVFKDFKVEVSGDVEDLSSASAKVVIDVNSIDTGNADRDGHLKADDFFDAAQYPEMTFETTRVTEDKITGNLTIKGVTHEETFDAEFNGVSANPLTGGKVTGVIVTGNIDREKYGINFNQALETGGVMIGKKVKFEAGLEFAIEEA